MRSSPTSHFFTVIWIHPPDAQTTQLIIALQHCNIQVLSSRNSWAKDLADSNIYIYDWPREKDTRNSSRNSWAKDLADSNIYIYDWPREKDTMGRFWQNQFSAIRVQSVCFSFLSIIELAN